MKHTEVYRNIQSLQIRISLERAKSHRVVISKEDDNQLGPAPIQKDPRNTAKNTFCTRDLEHGDMDKAQYMTQAIITEQSDS